VVVGLRPPMSIVGTKVRRVRTIRPCQSLTVSSTIGSSYPVLQQLRGRRTCCLGRRGRFEPTMSWGNYRSTGKV